MDKAERREPNATNVASTVISPATVPKPADTRKEEGTVEEVVATVVADRRATPVVDMGICRATAPRDRNATTVCFHDPQLSFMLAYWWAIDYGE